MGYRFYMEQLEATGTCPGAPLTSRRRRKMAWTDESRQTAIDSYVEKNPTPENSMEIVKAIAEEMDLKPAIINKAIKVAHKASFQDEYDKFDELETILETVGKTL